MHDQVLHGKTALITGSTSGIGLGIAQSLATRGANIVLNGFADAQLVAQLKRQIADDYGVPVAYHAADLSQPAQIAELMAFAIAEFGAVNILVNNAGIQHVCPIEQFPPQKWDEIIAVNLSAAFHTTRLALPAMRKTGWGRIVNIASVHGLVASLNKSAYIAAKHGLIGLTKATALETANSAITCNAICPGWVLTPLVQKQVDDRAAQEGLSDEQTKQRMLAEKQPSGEFVTPRQLGETVAFLCSDAAAQMRGASLPVDGAYLAQ